MPWDTEDWSMQLAAAGAVDVSMHDLNAGAPQELRQAQQQQLQDRKDRLKSAVSKRGRAATEELKQRNRAKLEELKKAREAMLPEGWRKVESRSRPGEFVYENVYTEERQAWFPTEPAKKVDVAAYDKSLEQAAAKAEEATKKGASGLSDEAKERNRRALAARKAKNQGFLPEGWRRVPSNSRPGEFVYENIYTEERVAWYPTEAAAKTAMPTQVLEQKKALEKAKALYDYQAANTEEIDLLTGDFVYVEFKADNGWWIGTNLRTGQLGMFPGGFVERV